MSERILTPAERLAARLLTGRLAHFAAGLADWAQLVTRYGWARLRRRPLG